ncbi:MAG: MFS transporter [Candidatus Binatia bacterium]|nr:MFS transporter [Candidatus Binatia bacterium]
MVLSTRTKLRWVAVLYFAEGFPFGLLFDALPVYFRSRGVSLVDIGLLSLAGLPWTLKFLWAPAVDLWGRRRSWIVTCQVLLALHLCFWLLHDPTDRVLWVFLVLFAVCSATQDIAIDAYTIELLDEEELGPANGVRVSTYRVALICAGGVFVALAGLIGWHPAFATAAIALASIALISSRAPRDVPLRPACASWAAALEHAVVGPVLDFWRRPGVLYVMLFILTFKLGDMTLGPMVRPFWVDRNFTPLQIGVVPGTIGVVSTIVGALFGGRLTKTLGLFHALWILGMAQAVSNLVYAAAAALPPSDLLMYSASVIESFCGGLGTAPFLAFLMSSCDKARAATQYALLSALFGLTRAISGAISGWAAQSMGYATYFTATFFLAWPAFILLPWVKRWIERRQ